MGRSEQIKMVSSHTWLTHPGGKSFHAYLSGKSGTHSVCESGTPITNLAKMELPGGRSPCCLLCFCRLYLVDLGAALKVVPIVGGES